jgi:hypothetical protein
MLGGGIGEWLYSHALGLRAHSRRAPPAGSVGRDAAGRACLREVGLGVDLRATHGVGGDDACVLARVMRRVRARRAAGEPIGAVVEFDSLRDMVVAERAAAAAAAAAQPRRAPAPAAAAAAPAARLVIDAHIAAALRSARGTIATPRGRLTAGWSLGGDGDGGGGGGGGGGCAAAAGGLAVTAAVPSGLALDVYVPAELLRGGALVTAAPARAPAGGEAADAAAVWSAAAACDAAGGACALRDEAGNGVVAGWARRGEADDRAEREADAGAGPAHLRLGLPAGAWCLRVTPP